MALGTEASCPNHSSPSTATTADTRHRALITLAGEIDLQSAPLVSAALAQCRSDGIRVIDVDLTPVTFCDCSGLNSFLDAALRTTETGGTLRLHHPPPTLGRLLDLTDSGPVLLGLPPGQPPQPPVAAPAAPQRGDYIGRRVPTSSTTAESRHSTERQH
ncbi:STAS domain-containing protein [Streptomyces sp. NPDC017991]|uniref:STAS domain-containing protein n=1 Tax=Streptomyces sp. NPDC017991 TaxID=3365026 RepID=UPI00378820EF